MKQPKNGQRTNYERSSRVPLFLPIIKFQGLKLVARAARRGAAAQATLRNAMRQYAEQSVMSRAMERTVALWVEGGSKQNGVRMHATDYENYVSKYLLQ